MTKFVLNTEDANWYSDLYKSVNGFRPNGFRPNGFVQFDCQEEFDSAIENLLEESKLQMEEDKFNEAKALEKFDARIGKLMSDHKLSRIDAIRWDMQAEGYDEFYMDCYLYHLGLNHADSFKVIGAFKDMTT